MRALRNRRRWSLLPAIVWLLTQLTMLAGSPATVGGQHGAGADGSADLTFICTAAGSVAVQLDGWPLPDTPPPAPDSQVNPCKWCQAFGLGILPPPPAGVIVRRMDWQPSVFALVRAPGGPKPAAIGFRSRAPPWIA